MSGIDGHWFLERAVSRVKQVRTRTWVVLAQHTERHRRQDRAAELRYAGRAPFDAVLAHYVKGFNAAGYSQEVVSATPEGEEHRFARERESVELALLRRPGGLVEVRLKMGSRREP